MSTFNHYFYYNAFNICELLYSRVSTKVEMQFLTDI